MKAQKTALERRDSERQTVKSDISVFIEGDVYLASMLDISDNGIRFETNGPQEIRIQIREDGEMMEYDAQLVWAKTNENGKMEYGLKRSPTKSS